MKTIADILINLDHELMKKQNDRALKLKAGVKGVGGKGKFKVVTYKNLIDKIKNFEEL
jgi:predicted nucleic acid-binding protein